MNEEFLISTSHQLALITSLPFAHTSEPQACNFIKKETLGQVFSCDFGEISKNTFFIEHLQATASECDKQEIIAPYLKVFLMNLRNSVLYVLARVTWVTF